MKRLTAILALTLPGLFAQTADLQYGVIYHCPSVNARVEIFSCAGAAPNSLCDVETDRPARPNFRGKSTRLQAMTLLRLCHPQTISESISSWFGMPAGGFAVSTPVKVVLFLVAAWGCRKLWNVKSKGVVDLTAYAPRPPAELSSADKRKLEAARQKLEQRLEQIEAKSQTLAAQIQQSEAQAAVLAARASSRDVLMASAANALNQAAPEFEAWLTGMEQRIPVGLTPWTSDIWKDFVQNPKPETLRHVCIAHVREALLPGEQGIRFPKTVPLLAAKGPLLVRCDAESKERSRAVIHNILLRAALAMPAEVRFSLIDPFGMGAGFPMRKLLPRVRPSAFP